MSVDPAFPPTDPKAGAADRLADITRRLERLEAGNPTIQVVTGTPLTAPRDGTPAVDTDLKFWVRVGGTWRFTTLT